MKINLDKLNSYEISNTNNVFNIEAVHIMIKNILAYEGSNDILFMPSNIYLSYTTLRELEIITDDPKKTSTQLNS